MREQPSYSEPLKSGEQVQGVESEVGLLHVKQAQWGEVDVCGKLGADEESSLIYIYICVLHEKILDILA